MENHKVDYSLSTGKAEKTCSFVRTPLSTAAIAKIPKKMKQDISDSSKVGLYLHFLKSSTQIRHVILYNWLRTLQKL